MYDLYWLSLLQFPKQHFSSVLTFFLFKRFSTGILPYGTIKRNLFIQKMYKTRKVQGVDLLARGFPKDYYLTILIPKDSLLINAS